MLSCALSASEGLLVRILGFFINLHLLLCLQPVLALSSLIFRNLSYLTGEIIHVLEIRKSIF